MNHLVGRGKNVTISLVDRDDPPNLEAELQSGSTTMNFLVPSFQSGLL